MAHEATAPGRRENTREILATPRAGENTPDPGAIAEARELFVTDPHAAVEELLDRVFRSEDAGAKAFTTKIPLSYPQLRRMAADGSIPSLGQILRFIVLAGPRDPFRVALAEHLDDLFRPAAPDPDSLALAVAAELARAGASVGEAQRAAEIVRDVVVEQCGPGRWVRR